MSTAARKKFNKKMAMWIAQEGRCWLCGERMPKPVMRANGGWPGADFPTLDHVVPASHGGDKSYANLMLAHQRCNVARGNRSEVRAIRVADNEAGI